MAWFYACAWARVVPMCVARRPSCVCVCVCVRVHPSRHVATPNLGRAASQCKSGGRMTSRRLRGGLVISTARQSRPHPAPASAPRRAMVGTPPVPPPLLRPGTPLWSGVATEPPVLHERPKRLVLATAGLPPGGGKSTFFTHVQRALGGAACRVVSSDYVTGNFDDAVLRSVQAQLVTCYDKNVPNAQGVQKLARVLAGLVRDFDVRVELVAPARLGSAQRDLCWERIRARPPPPGGNGRVLTVHSAGGEASAWAVFKGTFFDKCADFLPALRATGTAVVTDAFWAEDGAAAAASLARVQGWTAFASDPAAPLGAAAAHDLPFLEERAASAAERAASTLGGRFRLPPHPERRGRVFTAELWREPGVPLGLSLICPAFAVVTAVHAGSQMDQWNRNCAATFPADAIQRSDHILRANGAGPV